MYPKLFKIGRNWLLEFFDPVLIRKIRKLIKILANPYYTRALFKGVAAAIEHEQVLANLSCLLVVDIGANRGQFALAVRACCPDTTIISIEPLARPAAVFKQVFAGDSGTVLHVTAIGPRQEQRMMHISGRDDSSSLLPISSLQEEIFPGTGEVETTEVTVTPLDLLLSADEMARPAMLKIDVQGFEMEVLRGCEPLLENFDWIYAECSFVELYSGQKLASDVIQWLVERGFIISGIYNPCFADDGQSVQADFLFSRKANGK